MTAAVLVAIGLVATLATRGLDLRVAPWALAILAAFIPGWYAFDASNPYQVQKLFGMVVTLVAIAGAAYLITTPTRRVVWIWALLGTAAVFSISTVLFPGDTSTVGGLTIEGSNTIAAGQATGMGLVVALVFALASHARSRYLGILGALVFAGGVIASGSRGPFLAAIISIIAVAAALGKGRLWRVALLASGAVAGWLYLSNAANPGASRILNSLLGQIDATQSRDPLWAAATRAISENPFNLAGVGWGNFGTILRAGVISPDMRYYPHNVILEVWTEGGILALIATIAFICASLWRLWRGANSTIGAILLGIGLFSVVNAMVSGDVNDNRLMWVSLTVGWTVTLSQKPIQKYKRYQTMGAISDLPSPGEATPVGPPSATSPKGGDSRYSRRIVD